MPNKSKQKRRMKKEFKRRPRLIKQVEIEKTNKALRNIFVEVGILEGK
jgi:hypothetical protein